MSTANDYFKGYAPKVTIGQGNPETIKYGKLWNFPEYRKHAPGEFYSQLFLTHAKPRPGAHVIDYGCGTGRGGVMLASLGKLKVTMLDFVNNCLDEDVRKLIMSSDGQLTFIKADLEKRIPVVAEFGFTSDVMEHIPPDKVDLVLDNILQSAQTVWFTIATFEDSFGEAIGEHLHLSVHPFEWWKEQFEKRDCEIYYSQNQDNYYAHFYVRAWRSGQEVVDAGRLNTEEKAIIENVKYNIAQGWQQVVPHETNELECMILGGGPSLNQFEEEIIRNRADGVKCITLNGAYNWAVHHGITPSAQIVVDARQFNARFTKPVVNDCRYLIASQCHPDVFKELPKDRTFIWHTMAEQLGEVLDEQYGAGGWYGIPGGTTVLLRAIPLMRMLGYHKFILYGCDSCLMGDSHHAYEQNENANFYSLPVIINPSGRTFRCAPFMASQAHEFIDMIKYIGDEIELDVKGDGLLAHILEVGAEQAELQQL